MNRPASIWIPLLAALNLARPAPASDVARHLELTEDVTQGALRIADPEGELVECPLQHTSVQVVNVQSGTHCVWVVGIAAVVEVMVMW